MRCCCAATPRVTLSGLSGRALPKPRRQAVPGVRRELRPPSRVSRPPRSASPTCSRSSRRSCPSPAPSMRRFQADGPLHSLGGSGWVQLRWRHPLRRTGLAHPRPGHDRQRLVNLLPSPSTRPAGSIAATGSYDLNSTPLPGRRQGRRPRRLQNRLAPPDRTGRPPASSASLCAAPEPSTIRNSQATPRSPAWPSAGSPSAASSLLRTPPTTPSPTT